VVIVGLLSELPNLPENAGARIRERLRPVRQLLSR
jgi:hypothetical protein